MISRKAQVLIAVAIGLSLIVPVVAHAATLFYRGSVDGERKAVVGFEVRGPRDSDGGIKFGTAKVEDFVISGVKVTRQCAGQEATTTSGAFLFEDEIDVQGDGDFRGKETPKILGSGIEGSMVVKGQYSERNAEFVGSFRLQAVERDPSHGDCVYTVDKVHWTAFRR